MKTLPLKLDDAILSEAEFIITELKLARNRYINEAFKIYNTCIKRRLKKKLNNESNITRDESMDILHEFEMLLVDN